MLKLSKGVIKAIRQFNSEIKNFEKGDRNE